MSLQKGLQDGIRELRYHGGNINAARHLFPDAPEPWIDLSTGINPVAYPVAAIAPSAWTRLPEAADIEALEAGARYAYGAAPSVDIVAAPGTQALIQWLPRLFPVCRVAVVGPTYDEHETCWRATGSAVTLVSGLSELASFDVGVVVNPNNPDGRTFAPDDLTEIAKRLAGRGGRLVVDEAFMDVIGQQSSLVPRLPLPGVVVLRSFGKTYGLAGLRLGFAVASVKDCAQLRGALGPWAVSGPAVEIGRRALGDNAWLTETVRRLAADADRLDRLLQSAGIDVVGGTPLFRLASTKDAGRWFEQLCRTGILTRPFRENVQWLRFGIPQGTAAWSRLEAALRSRTAK